MMEVLEVQKLSVEGVIGFLDNKYLSSSTIPSSQIC